MNPREFEIVNLIAARKARSRPTPHAVQVAARPGAPPIADAIAVAAGTAPPEVTAAVVAYCEKDPEFAALVEKYREFIRGNELLGTPDKESVLATMTVEELRRQPIPEPALPAWSGYDTAPGWQWLQSADTGQPRCVWAPVRLQEGEAVVVGRVEWLPPRPHHWRAIVRFPRNTGDPRFPNAELHRLRDVVVTVNVYDRPDGKLIDSAGGILGDENGDLISPPLPLRVGHDQPITDRVIQVVRGRHESPSRASPSAERHEPTGGYVRIFPVAAFCWQR